MLPPGHIAGGYLVVYTFVRITNPDVTESQAQTLLFLGMTSAFAPDLDMFYSFWKSKAMRLGRQEKNHRYYLTHTPLFWLFTGAVIAILPFNTLGIYSGLAVCLGAWSHLFLDSLQFGIMWLHPFTRRLFSFFDRGIEFPVEGKGFWGHWVNFFFSYAKHFTLTFVLEITLIVAVFIVIFWFPI